MVAPETAITLTPDGNRHGGECRVTVTPALSLTVLSKALSQIMRTPNLGEWGAYDDTKVTILHSHNNAAGEEGLRGVRVIVEHLLG